MRIMIEKKNLKLFAEQNVNWGDVKPHRFNTAGLTVSTKNHDSQNQTGGKSLSLSLSLSLSALCSLYFSNIRICFIFLLPIIFKLDYEAAIVYSRCYLK